jgi:hypothetical protein
MVACGPDRAPAFDWRALAGPGVVPKGRFFPLAEYCGCFAGKARLIVAAVNHRNHRDSLVISAIVAIACNVTPPRHG